MTRRPSPTWRRRAPAAEERAARAEHLLRLARGRARLWRERALCIASGVDTVEARTVDAEAELAQVKRTLTSLASRHLGDGATDVEIAALVAKWREHDSSLAERADAAPAVEALGKFWESLQRLDETVRHIRRRHGEGEGH